MIILYHYGYFASMFFFSFLGGNGLPWKLGTSYRNSVKSSQKVSRRTFHKCVPCFATLTHDVGLTVKVRYTEGMSDLLQLH